MVPFFPRLFYSVPDRLSVSKQVFDYSWFFNLSYSFVALSVVTRFNLQIVLKGILLLPYSKDLFKLQCFRRITQSSGKRLLCLDLKPIPELVVEATHSYPAGVPIRIF